MTNRGGMGGHQSSASVKEEWLTPPAILEALGPFDLDPCAPIKLLWPTAREHYTIADNGLIKRWKGRVFLNPPYGPPPVVGPWLRRMADHGMGTALIFARTETDLFFETVWDKADAVLFLRGRLYFHYGPDFVDKRGVPKPHGERADANAGAPSVLVAYGRADAIALADCHIPGKYIRLKERGSIP